MPPGNLSKDDAKTAMKEAIKEWMDAKFAQLGRWSFGVILVALLTAVFYFVVMMSGWHK